jgi:putative ABC transport system ATP-binding protein
MLIVAREISRRYGSPPFQSWALTPTCLHIDHGEFVAIVGASGSGKSTLMNLLGLLDHPTSGRLFFEGRDTTTLGPDAIAAIRNRRIGYVFQQYHLLPRLTALRNVELPLVYAGESRRGRRRRAEAALDAVGLLSKVDRLPAKLSGGEQQRVAIARALVVDPALLLADEPTGALDTQSGREVLMLIQQLHQQGRTIVMVTHDLQIATQAPRVMHMSDGAVVSDDDPVAPLVFHRELVTQ